MRQAVTVVILISLTLLFFQPTKTFSQANDNSMQTVIHLLSYVATDYPQAVKDGKIINEQEYQEQKEFSAQAYDLVKGNSFFVGKNTDVLNQLQSLIALVEQKRPAKDISETADKVKNTIIKITGIQTAPKSWPDIKNGQTLYSVKCMVCHGDRGDGRGQDALNLDPPPTNFLDTGLMRKSSPFQAFNTIKLGVQGTSMRPFPELSEKEVWDLAFYIKSFPYQKKIQDTNSLRQTFNHIFPRITLTKVSTLSDNQLLDTLKILGGDRETNLEALRILTPEGEGNNSLSIAINNLNGSLQDYTEGNKTLARTKALSAYLEGIEPVEARLRAADPKFVLDLEQQMLNVRQAIEKNKGNQAVKVEIEKALDMIAQANKILMSHKTNFLITFILAASIFLREGVEAFLILAVIIALIRSSGVNKALPWLHGGWITAVVAGVAGWFLSDYIIRFGGKNREIMEGLVSLFAVVILIWVGFWLHSKTEAKQWTNFIKNKIGNYLQKDKMLGLAVFSFVVVFREAFEVILFLQAVSLETAPGNQSAIGLGVLAATAIIIIIAYLFLKYSKMVPVRKLFLYSSWIIVILAIILMGKGFHSLQESGWIGVSTLPTFLRVEWLGIYPTLQTILAQAALIAAIIIIYFIQMQAMKNAEVKRQLYSKSS